MTISPMQLKNPFIDKQIVIYDVETYKDFFLAVFREEEERKIFTIENLDELKSYISDKNKVLVGYNSISFDDLILKSILLDKVHTDKEISELANIIIRRQDPGLIKYLKWNTPISWHKSVDLMQLAFSDDDTGAGKASLKDIAIRLKCGLIQGLPYEVDMDLTEDQKQEITKYCINDVAVTTRLWNELSDEVKLRLELNQIYNVNVTSFSRPQSAEEILKQQYIRKSGLDFKQLRDLKTDLKEIPVKDCIPDWIKFDSKELQELLGKIKPEVLPIKITKEFNRIKKYIDGSALKQIVNISGKSYSFGTGGFHSEDVPGIFVTTSDYTIMDLDATSYYPAIIILLGLFPAHLTSIWTKNFKEITDKRIRAKKDGLKLKAEAMKIIINSSFGKTNEQYSFMYDPKLMVTVTLTGQLLIMMLIEKMVLSGIEVISANTDGITCKVPVDKRAEFELIRGQWEQLTRFQLEDTVYKKYIRKDVNNYIAEYPDGKLKRKGIFEYGNIYKKNDAAIVAKALEKYFIHDIPIEETMKNGSIYDYFYSFKATRGFKVCIGDKEIQKINRWYVSNNGGVKIEKIRLSDNQRIQVSNADSAKILNNLKSETLPADLDYQYYIIEAKKIVYRILNSSRAEEVKSLGLHPIPKEFKRNLSGSKMKDIRDDWQWGENTGIACYTGIDAGTIAIDFDIPEIAIVNGIYGLLDSSVVAWHGEGSAEDVITGKKKGTIIYKCNNENITSTKEEFLKKYGFEVIYGKNAAQLTGFHSNGEDYHYSGQLQSIPQKFERWILDHLPRQRRRRTKRQQNEPDLFGDTSDDRELLKNIITNLLPGWEYREISKDNYKLQGYCPFQDEHTRSSNRTDFDIVLSNDGLLCGCFHSSCETSTRELKRKINDAWINTKKQQIQDNQDELEHKQIENRERVLKEIIISDCIDDGKRETLEFKTIYEAFRADGRVRLIQAPTGCGKTYNSVTYFLEKIQQEEFVIYITSNKTSMQEFIDQVEERTGKAISELYIQELRKGYDIDDLETEEVTEAQDNSNTIKKSTLGIITHHTYLTRKGLSNIHFGLLAIIDKYGATIIIDEVDSYIQAQTFILALEARYERRSQKGWEFALYNRKNKCPGARNKPKCSNCHMSCQVEYKPNKEGIPELRHMTGIKEVDFNNQELDLPVLAEAKTVYIPERGLTIRQLEQHKDYLDKKEYKYRLYDEEKYSLKQTIADLINCSFNPVIYTYSPTLNKKNIEPEEIADLPEQERYKVKYPSTLCQVNYLSLKDKSSLRFLDKKAGEVVLLSATISQSDKDFIQECFSGEVQEITISETSQKIDELLLIGYGGYVKYISKTREVNIDGMSDYGKVLIFEPTRVEAKELYNSFPEKYPVAMYEVRDLSVKEKFSENWHYLITHSRGNIGRAVNLPKFYTCFINTTIYKPSNAYDLKNFTIEEIMERQEDDRKTTTIQNAGRILRGSGRKVICLCNMSPDELDYFKSRFEIMVGSEIKTCYVEEDQDKLLNTIDYYHKTGGILDVDEYSKIDKAIDGYTRVLSKKQRANLTDEEKEQYLENLENNKKSRRETLIQSKIDKIKELQDAGKSWREIQKKINFYKLSEEERVLIKNEVNPDEYS